MNNGFAWNRKCIQLVTKQPRCVVSVFSDTSSVLSVYFLHLHKNLVITVVNVYVDLAVFMGIAGTS